MSEKFTGLWPTPQARMPGHSAAKIENLLTGNRHSFYLTHAVAADQIQPGIITDTPEPKFSPQLTLFAEAFPVSRIVLLADEADLKTSATSGPSLPDSFASLNPDGSWRKTCQGYSQVTLDGSLESFSGTWPRAGMTRNGIAYLRQPLVLLTDVTESGSLPTPTVGDSKSARNATAIRRRIPPTGIHAGYTLTDHVTLWPTPRNCTAMAAVFTENPANAKFPNLETMVARREWPTPTSRDWKDGRKPYDRKKDGSSTQDTLGRVLAASGETSGGSLNPTWVEWLMGYPLGWTVCEGWGTRLFRKSQNGSLAVSSPPKD